MSLELDFYEDDEGVSVDLALSVFGPSFIQCINLDSDSVDEKMKKTSIFLLRNRKVSSKKSQLKPKYIVSVYMVQLQKT